MKSFKELIEDLKSDEAFAVKFNEAIAAKREAGAKNYYETILPAAEEFGYQVSKEELDEMMESQSENLTEEELGKVAGGTSCLPAWTTAILTGVSVASIVASITVIQTEKD